jgi:heme exporter protein D
MGGYAAYVWPAYAITFIVLLGLGWTAYRAVKRQESALERLDAKVEEVRE